ncbi:MAG: hypothetical protein R6U96_00420 [Promethearchaeia archaeon]
MPTANKIHLSFEIGKLKNQVIEAGITKSFRKDRIFEEVIKEILEFYHGKKEFEKKIDLNKVEVFVNRPPEKSHKPTEENLDKYCPLARKVRIPSHKKMKNKNLELSVEKVVKTSKIGVFTIYY